MKPSHIRGLIRVSGLLAALCALVAAGMGIKLLLRFAERSFGFSQLEGLLFFALAALLLRATYLAWFQWSPLAIRHGLAVLFFFPTLCISVGLSTLARGGWIYALFLLSIIAGYLLYRYTSAVLAQKVFTTPVGDLACSYDEDLTSDESPRNTKRWERRHRFERARFILVFGVLLWGLQSARS
jgi:hypothetical protein